MTDVLGVAFFNQKRFARRRKTRFDYLISRDLLKEEELDSSWEESREQKETMEAFLMKRYKISKEDLGKSFADFYRCKFVQFNDKIPIPEDLIKNLKKDYMRRELWVPISKLVDDPNNILKRDMIENLMKTKAIRYDVALTEDITNFINYFFQSPEEETSISDILGKMDADADDSDEEAGEVVTESDSAIMQLVNKIINDAYTRRTSDIHIEPNIGKKNVEVRFRAALISRIKIMSNLDITIKRLPQDGKIKFRRPGGGRDRVTGGDDSHPGRRRGCRHAHPGQRGNPAPGGDGDVAPELQGAPRYLCRKALRDDPRGGSHRFR